MSKYNILKYRFKTNNLTPDNLNPVNLNAGCGRRPIRGVQGGGPGLGPGSLAWALGPRPAPQDL